MHRPFPAFRSRRMRKHAWSRALVCEHQLHPNNLILPLFVHVHPDSQAIPSMPGVQRHSLQDLIRVCEQAAHAGIPAVALFPVIDTQHKDAQGSHALQENNILIQALQLLKKERLPLGLITDVALDPYTSHSHDGILQDSGFVDNDKTIAILAKQACLQAQAGADIIAPSDMQDGRIQAIRTQLDQQGHQEVSILAYTAKYASAFYGPFREAIGADGFSKKQTNIRDKKHYQMSPSNSREALDAAYQNLQEGADCIMVKPGLPYLDIIQTLHQQTQAPIFAYQVSGEYSMLHLLAKKSGQNPIPLIHEALLCMRRAGAQSLLTYAALELAQTLSLKSTAA